MSKVAFRKEKRAVAHSDVRPRSGGPYSLFCCTCQRWIPSTASHEMKKEGIYAYSHTCMLYEGGELRVWGDRGLPYVPSDVDASMNNILFAMTLEGAPRTKKNSQQIFKTRNGIPFVAPSKAFKAYERECLSQLRKVLAMPIKARCNMRCVYYMPTRRRVDLGNLLAATCDILVAGAVLEDDHCGIVASHDGSYVDYDKDRPRVEIEITQRI